MNRISLLRIASVSLSMMVSSATSAEAPEATATATPREIRTPKPSPAPHINGPARFGVRPGHPLLYRIPATGERPIQFLADGLPTGLKLDPATGQITGMLAEPGEHAITLHAKNARGTEAKKFQIVVGETIALTPPMGWNSWNHYASRVSADIVLQNAKAMVASGLVDHGWTYLNIDDAWQGARGGEFHAIQGNEKFPDMKALADAVHALGLKIGIYSTPWVESYAGYCGGSAENPEGTFAKTTEQKRGKINKKVLPWAIGQYHFASNDAKQWGAWGIDYLKYDWNPIELPETKEIYDALRASGRDIALSLSNSTPFQNIPDLSKLANAWRTSGDIKANWQSMSTKGFGEDKWLPFAGPGHWNDPDMLEIGTKEKNQPGLTPDEEYTHMTLWCLVSAPLLLGNDLSELDDFTLNLLTNDEVLAVNQDALGKQGTSVGAPGELVVFVKDLADGSKAVGLFNRGATTATVTAKWSDLGITGAQTVRDLWRQKDLGRFEGEFALSVASHGAEMIKVSK